MTTVPGDTLNSLGQNKGILNNYVTSIQQYNNESVEDKEGLENIICGIGEFEGSDRKKHLGVCRHESIIGRYRFGVKRVLD